MYRNGIKRLLAIVLSLCGMVCLSWLFLILAVAIKLDSPGPVFFKQKRVGIGKKHFYILKFRTMRIDTPHDMPTHLLHDPDQYITRMGHFRARPVWMNCPSCGTSLWGIWRSSARGLRCGTSMICWPSATSTMPTMCARA